MKRFTFLIILTLGFGLTVYAEKTVDDCRKECEAENTRECICKCLKTSCQDECINQEGEELEKCNNECEANYNSCITPPKSQETTGTDDLPEDTKKIIQQQVREKLGETKPTNFNGPKIPENPVDIEIKFE